MDFKDKFLQLRKEKQIGQEQLAKMLGVSKGVVSFWETGRNEPSLPMLKKIAEYFNVSTDFLVGIEDEFGTKISIHNSFNNSDNKNIQIGNNNKIK